MLHGAYWAQNVDVMQSDGHATEFCAGPRSKDILTSGLERLAPGQELPSPGKPAARLAERKSSGFGNRVDSDIDSDDELSLDGSSQQPGVSLHTLPFFCAIRCFQCHHQQLLGEAL